MSFKQWLDSAKSRRALKQERLIISVTESIIELLAEKGMSKAALAERLDVGRSHVTQLLSGSRNMTLRSLSDISDALDCQATVTFKPNACIQMHADLGPESKSYRPVKFYSLASSANHSDSYAVDVDVPRMSVAVRAA